MAKDIDLEIKSILGGITEVNSRNEQKIVAVASWNGRPDTVEVRRYNVVDEILTKGIGFTPEEAAELVYILLASPNDVKYDREKVYQILKEQEELEVDVQKLVSALPETPGQYADMVDPIDAVETASYGNSRRIVPKKNGLFTHLYKN
jgi:hypothetical protein